MTTHSDGNIHWRCHCCNEAHIIVLKGVAWEILNLELAGGINRGASVTAVACMVEHCLG